jgi:phenylpyruvate tautomerase PptA (4-oxalocrotonate tautomerase family)
VRVQQVRVTRWCRRGAPERRQAIVAAITEAVLDAENSAYGPDPMRVWVFTPEIPDGTWGGGGRVVTLADIVGFAVGDQEKAAATPSGRWPSGAVHRQRRPRCDRRDIHLVRLDSCGVPRRPRAAAGNH